MGTKQVQMEFQVAANDGVSAQVTVTVNGVQKFSGALAQTVNPLPGIVTPDQVPFSLVQFDLDVEDMPVDPNSPSNPPSNLGGWTTPVDVTIAVSGGDICLQETEANYVTAVTSITPPTRTTSAVYSCTPGDAGTFVGLTFANQPVWTPTAVGRFNYNDNPVGSLLLLDNESVAYQLAVSLYSA